MYYIRGKVLPYKGIEPKFADGVFVADGAFVIGDVVVDEFSSIWFNVVVRGDVNYIKIGKYTNIQDLTMVHVTSDRFPCIIGDYVTVGHSAVVHGCKVGDYVLIGMGAVILDGATISEYSLVAAGSVVPPGKKYPSGVLIKGSPAVVARELTEEEKVMIRESALHYFELAKTYCLS